MAVCFISYARRPLDELALAQITALLRRAGITFWWDKLLTHSSGAGLNAEIANELRAARAVLALASSQSLSSPYCQAEIVYALEHDKPVVRIDAEPCVLPPALLPLASARTVIWREASPANSEVELALALAELGIDASEAFANASGGAESILYHPSAALIRPSYSTLRQAGIDASHEYVRRLNQAAALNPQNPYNELSLAFIWLFQRDAARSFQAARKALNLLQLEPDAHYAEALALCLQSPPDSRSKAEVEAILRRLAVARRLPNAGAHIALLTALVIANYYSPRYLTPPASPNDILLQGLAAGCRFDRSENLRVIGLEPVRDEPFSPRRDLLAAYLQS